MKWMACALILLLAPVVQAGTGDNPWPEIRKSRIHTLLPKVMARAGVDAWLVLCRENNNDPLAEHVGCENAGQLAAFLFYRNDKGFHSRAFSPVSEATALAEGGTLDKVISVPRSQSALEHASAFIKQQGFKQIAVNSSDTNAQADGLSHTQRLALEQALGADFSNRLVSSDELVYHWLSVKLPQEISIMTEAAELASRWQYEVYDRIIPGRTTDADVARWLKQKMRSHGVGDAWAPAQNPNVNSGPDRGHSHATDKVIMPGDVIQIDFGVRLHDRWVSDIQRFAYVLKPGQAKAPEHIQRAWEAAIEGNRAAFAAMAPGVRGVDVDEAQRKVMERRGSLPVMWSTGHPVGYVAHDTGPNLGGARQAEVRPASHRTLATGMVFAFDGFYSWQREDGSIKTISVEEMVEITATGARYLVPPQRELVLIPSAVN